MVLLWGCLITVWIAVIFHEELVRDLKDIRTWATKWANKGSGGEEDDE